MKIDPSHTKMLRLQYSRQLTRLFKRFQKHAVKSVLAIIDNYNNNYIFSRKMTRKTLRQTGVNQDIERYLDWATEQDIISPSEDIIYSNVKKSYTKGVKDASRSLKRYPNYAIGTNLTMLDWEAMMQIQDINRLLITAATDNMKRAIQYTATQGILNGWGTTKIAYEIRRNVHGNSNMGIVRAKMIARTEIINAYNVAAKKRYEQAGLKESEMIWITAFDERTCEICAGNDGKTIAQIGEIPAIHPNCRCAIAPNPKKGK